LSWPIRVATAVAVVIVAVLVFFATNGWSLDRVLNTCVGQDQEDIAELHPVVDKTLEGVKFKPSNYEGCINDGTRGDAGVVAYVLSWRQRGIAMKHLASQAWVRQEGFMFRSPDGEYSASVSMGSEPDGPPHAVIHFGIVD
jgi:hypothetical protein